MSHGELLIGVLDSAIWEMGEAFKGLADEDLWRRPHPRLLSVGELATHVGYWEARSFLGEGFATPLNQHAARYYSVTMEEPFKLSLTSAELYAEIERIHAASKTAFLALSPDLKDQNPHREGWTWETVLQYQGFHVAYHTGQIYAVRHLFGHETVDN